MKHTIEELTLAAHVRELAIKIRTAQARDLSEPEFHALVQQPLDPYIEEAMNRLEQVAEIIRTHPQKAP